MSGEIIEVRDIKTELTIDATDVARVGEHLRLIRDFVKKDLKSGINGDYAIIPDTKKYSLLKPGAEKLMRLYGLGVRLQCILRDLDKYENFAMFIYQAEVYHIKTGAVVAQCEGTANNLESKYESQKAFNILNTLMKMAQKRAVVGAVILAVGASDYFTQDEDEIQTQQPKRQTVDSSKFEQSTTSDGSYVIQAAKKFKGQRIEEIKREDMSGYVNWLKENNVAISGKLEEDVQAMRNFLNLAG